MLYVINTVGVLFDTLELHAFMFPYTSYNWVFYLIWWVDILSINQLIFYTGQKFFTTKSLSLSDHVCLLLLYHV